jgi:hypothetical protein
MLNKILDALASVIKQLLDRVEKQDITATTYAYSINEVKPKTPSLVEVCHSYVGKDASPDDLAPDALGCAETVSDIIKKVLPDFKVQISTYELMKQLNADTRFKRVPEPVEGAVLLYATGTQPVGSPIAHGHVGIVGEGGFWYSNQSSSGNLMKHWTVKDAVAYYEVKSKFPRNVYVLNE